MTNVRRTGRVPVLCFFLIAATPLEAQIVVRSWLPWRTIETAHFSFHYPVELEAWTRNVASHADAIDSAVSAIVGYSPPRRTQVVVDNPYEIANGSAWPILNTPIINLWASPATPREDIGQYRDWGEMLVSHEFGHIAHLSRPSRNPLTRALWKLAPLDVGPLPLEAPRWVVEGYATYIEGRVTGSGRPHGNWRPAILRKLALEGQLPQYGQLNASSAYDGGEFAYLVGSAFLTWLADRNGDSSLVHLWRRMSARTPRTFDESFVGVFGESPAALYGKFAIDLTAKALAAAQLIGASGRADTGAIVQRLSWDTGDPSISADGRRAAIVLRSPVLPSRVVVWSTAPEPDTGRARRDSVLLAHDPLDVPARAIYPPAKRVLATLRARGGSGYTSPRFLRDGRILVSRLTSRGDGTLASDLYIWDPQHHSVRRVTHGASLSDGDPAPDGRSIVATRCRQGWCDVVALDLSSGVVRTLLAGSPTISYYRPRVSPDGSRIAVAVNRGSGWRLTIANVGDSSAPLDATPDSMVNSYDASWVTATTLVAVSERGGVANIHELDLASDAWRQLTDVTGAAVAPAANPADSSVWFLSLYARGFDLRSVRPNRDGAIPPIALPSGLSPAAPVPSVDTIRFSTNALTPPRHFGFSPRMSPWIPQPEANADGLSAALAVSSIDIVGRSHLLVNGAFGAPALWRGGAVNAGWYGWRPSIQVRLFDAAQRPSFSRSNGAAEDLDAHLAGAELFAEYSSSFDTWGMRTRLGGSIERAHLDLIPDSIGSVPHTDPRSLGFLDVNGVWVQRGVGASLTEALSVNGTAGRAFDSTLSRGVASASIASNGPVVPALRLAATYGRTNESAPTFERFALGGGASPLIDASILSQRLSMPALPTGVSVGSSAVTYRIALGFPSSVSAGTGLAGSIYWWGGSTTSSDSTFRVWHRVVGAEWSGGTGAVPFLGTPAARGVIGVGESLDAPLRHRVRGYVTLVLDP